MQKIRVIIADTDENYIMPLQLKFIQEFFGKIDLEIITDREYFTEFFNKPQKAEILIASEDLYDLAIQRHDIANVFVLVEQFDANAAADNNATRLLKYTSIKEIFKEITDKSYLVLNDDNHQGKETQIIVVTSAAGGVGKTTVAMGISAALEKSYKRVLYINADRLQHFQHMLEDANPITTSELYGRLMTSNQGIYSDIKNYVRQELFSYLPPFKAALMSLGLNYSVFENIAKSAKNSSDYDFIVVDADVSFDEDKASLFDVADKVVIVTNQSKESIFATNLYVSNINGINTDKYVFVCNDFDEQKKNAIMSNDVLLKFVVNEYINHFQEYDSMRPNDFANDSGVQKTAFLVR